MENKFNTPSSSTTSSSPSFSPLPSSPIGSLQQQSFLIDGANASVAGSTTDQLLIDLLTTIIEDPSAVPAGVDLQTILTAVQLYEMQEKLMKQQQYPNVNSLLSSPMGQHQLNMLQQLPQQQLPTKNQFSGNPSLLYPHIYSMPQANSTYPNRFGQVPIQFNSQGVPTTKKEFKPRNTRSGRQQAQYSHLIERTIYVTELVHDITEADIANFFSRCGEVVDCRLIGDAHSRMRMAFVEFSQNTYYFAVPESLKLNKTLLHGNPIRVQRSKTAIIPISPRFLPQNEEEALRCQRTVCVKNIDKRFQTEDVKAFFENLAVDESIGADGKVERVKLVPDNSGPSSTLMAYVEFCSDESVTCALNQCQGALMGCLPLRICASKIPIRTAEEERSLKETAASGVNN
eukprot:TRINITY_DN564_c0_g1_i1.p1 TRINITY_DN564_c0_g1~~TRINITY_DN564_c0_g1_i1.p1  ORF type:complete len:401 (-),score=37.71 TRINITY_DN564_c0_g1_i1:1799-3001(-)